MKYRFSIVVRGTVYQEEPNRRVGGQGEETKKKKPMGPLKVAEQSRSERVDVHTVRELSDFSVDTILSLTNCNIQTDVLFVVQ